MKEVDRKQEQQMWQIFWEYKNRKKIPKDKLEKSIYYKCLYLHERQRFTSIHAK